MHFFRSLVFALLFLELFAVFSPEALAENVADRSNGIPAANFVEPRITKERTDRDQPLPDTETIKTTGKVEDLFGQFYFSNQIPLKDAQWVVGKDPVQAELDLMSELITKVQKKQIPASEAHLILTRYHLGDDRVFDLLEKAAKAGINVDVMTDLNDSVTTTFKKGEKSKVFGPDTKVTPNTSPNGKMYAKLRKIGFEPGTEKNKPRLGIYSQQLFNKKADRDAAEEGQIIMYDIMHEKSIVAAHVKDGKVVWSKATSGSANMVSHGVSEKLTGDPNIVTRVNLIREIIDPDLAKRRYEHALNLRHTLSTTGNISDSKKEQFLRVETKNGWVETAFTGGKHNLNDRIAALTLHGVPGMNKEHVAKAFDKGVESYYDRLTKEFGGWEIKEIRESQFVWTHGQGREAEKFLFDGNPEVKKLGIYDAKFNEVTGWGFPLVQSAGVDLLRKMGGTIFSWKKAIADRVKSMIYLRGIPGVKETDLDGPPIARFLLHTKLYMVRGVLKDGTEVTVIFDGSLNRSNHKENAEDQDMIVIRGKSKLADAYWSIPELLLKTEPEYFKEASVALMGDTFARFTGHTPLELPHDFGENLGKLISAGEFEKVKKELEKLAESPTTLKVKPKAKEIQDRIDKFVKYLEWHKEKFPWQFGKGDNFYLHKLMDVAAIMHSKNMQTSQAAYELKGLMWSRDSTPESQAELAKEAWEIIGMKAPFPEMKSRDAGSAHEAASSDGHRDRQSDAAQVRESIDAAASSSPSAREAAKIAKAKKECAEADAKLAPKKRKTASAAKKSKG